MGHDIQEITARFREIYPDAAEVHVYSAPGRTEICGNHTDHQQGCVLAAAVNLETIAAVSFTGGTTVRLFSEGYSEYVVDVSDTAVRVEETGTTQAIIRGVAAGFERRGARVGGFNAYVTSDVLSGSGLSSSAAFEVLIATIFNEHFNGNRFGAVEIAKIGQEAENMHFGKQSGLMDQMVCAVGNFVFVDFRDPDNPRIEKHDCDFKKAGLDLFVTDTKGSHADLIEDYVSIPAEMNLVAAQFGVAHLRGVDPQDFFKKLPSLRAVCSDRALLRAAHFFAENERALAAAQAVRNDDIRKFLEVIRASGLSSAQLLQNLYSIRKPTEQAIPLALMVSEKILGNRGAARVHGGGFAGTIQAFVPSDLSEEYRQAMDGLFGEGSALRLEIRPEGGVKVL